MTLLLEKAPEKTPESEKGDSYWKGYHEGRAEAFRFVRDKVVKSLENEYACIIKETEDNLLDRIEYLEAYGKFDNE